jgi:hypothetical protein
MTQAQRFCALAANRADPNHRLVGERMLGISRHYLGDQVRARPHFEGVLDEYVESENRSHIVRFRVDLRVPARTFLAPSLWLLGYPDQAMRAAEAAIEDAASGLGVMASATNDRFYSMHVCFGRFRLERSPGGACTHWKSAALSRRTWRAGFCRSPAVRRRHWKCSTRPLATV